MAKELGTFVLLYVREAGGEGAYTVVKGQQTTNITRARAQVDTTDKSTEGFRTSLSGLKDVTVSATGQVDWADTAGWGVLEDAYEESGVTGGLVDVYLRQNAAGRGYIGTMTITSLDTNGETESPTEYNINLASNSVLVLVESATITGDTATVADD